MQAAHTTLLAPSLVNRSIRPIPAPPRRRHTQPKRVQRAPRPRYPLERLPRNSRRDHRELHRPSDRVGRKTYLVRRGLRLGLVREPAEAARALLVVADRLVEVLAVEVRPEDRREPELR